MNCPKVRSMRNTFNITKIPSHHGEVGGGTEVFKRSSYPQVMTEDLLKRKREKVHFFNFQIP